MPYPRRHPIPHAIYHATSRGNDRRPLFLDDIDRHRYLYHLEMVLRRHDLECVAWCLMTNHTHLLVRCCEPTVSVALRDLHAVYCRQFNRRHGFSGHVLGRRPYLVHVEDDPQLITTARYILMNPVTAGLCATPAEWPWSSFRALRGLRPATFENLDLLWAFVPPESVDAWVSETFTAFKQ